MGLSGRDVYLKVHDLIRSPRTGVSKDEERVSGQRGRREAKCVQNPREEMFLEGGNDYFKGYCVIK